MPTSTKKKTWKHNPARDIILQDLEAERLPLDEKEMSAEEAFSQFYANDPIVEAVGLKCSSKN